MLPQSYEEQQWNGSSSAGVGLCIDNDGRPLHRSASVRRVEQLAQIVWWRARIASEYNAPRRAEAAKLLGVSRATIVRKIKQYGLN